MENITFTRAHLLLEFRQDVDGLIQRVIQRLDYSPADVVNEQGWRKWAADSTEAKAAVEKILRSVVDNWFTPDTYEESDRD